MHADLLTAREFFTLLPLLTGNRRERHGENLGEAAAPAEVGKLRPPLDPKHYFFGEIRAAHAAVESVTVTGKVVITVS